MKNQLEKRLAELKSEFTAGQKMMTELENKQSSLRDTLLRISGAIQILEEEINKVNETLELEESAQETNVKSIN